MIIANAGPLLTADDHNAVERVMTSGAIADGPDIVEFENEFAALHNPASAVAVSSGFAALHLALAALNVRPGDDVIVPCLSTCPAIPNAVRATGARAIFCDTNRDNFNLSSDAVRQRLTAKTVAIIAPHHTGVVADIAALCELGLPVIEDCAQALGAHHAGQRVGTMGTVAIHSFYPTKIITAIDGGMLVSMKTDIIETARRLRYYRGYMGPEKRFNYRMQNINAAIGRVQLARLSSFIERRSTIAKRYHELFVQHGVSADRFLHRSSGDIYFRFAVRVEPEHRDHWVTTFTSHGVPCSTEVGFLCEPTSALPNAVALSREALTLPTYPALTDDHVSFLIDTIGTALEEISP